MRNPKPSHVIQACLNDYLPHNEKRVASWYNNEMEVQVMVSPIGGEPVERKNGVYYSNESTYQWYNFRIPKNANTDPIDNDIELRYPLEKHIEALGLTGWNWRQKKSIRVGFDFDSITGHAKGIGIDDDQLDKIKEKLMQVPEALVLRSTGGLGFHLYFEFNPQTLPETNNHTEHAALALACLKMISHQVGFDFQAGLDVGGGNMWIWHRKMTPQNKGLTVLKDNIYPDGTIAYMQVPQNWRLYIDVATRKRQKVRIEGVPDDEQDSVSNKAAAQKSIPLDNTHKRIITDLQQYYPNFSTVWIPDHQLLQTHTSALKMYFEARNASGSPLVGIFNTLSEGRNPETPNCFCFPLDGGGFRVVRFGKGTKEHDSWQFDRSGWTYTYYNQAMNFYRASAAYNGIEDDTAGFTFSTADSAISAVQAMGHKIEIPIELVDRKVTLRPHKGGKLLVEVENFKTDKDLDIVGWIKKRTKWIKIYNINIAPNPNELSIDFEDVDNSIRAVITTDNTLSGWHVKHEQGMWMPMAKDDARSKLKSVGYEDKTEAILGTALSKAWIHVNLPFREEYPGNRQWNLNAAQLRFDPQFDYDATEESLHPYWDLILTHIGSELDEYLVKLPWAQKNNIKTGKDYLTLWISCMIREPFEPLPYLFLYGIQNSGKSILHEAISILMTRGVMRADTALTNPNDFNGELAGAILCVVEEKDITRAGALAYNKIKDWVTSPSISIHAKYKQVFQQRNSTHWIQCANDKNSCPIFPGDTRITMIEVAELIPGSEVPKQILLTKLEEEAPYFLATLLNTSLPDLEHRLRVHIVATSNKDQMEDSNQSILVSFLEEKCFYAAGACVKWADFYALFASCLSGSDEKSEWTKSRVAGALPAKFPMGYYTGNCRHVGNISFIPTDNQSFVFICRDGKLIKKLEN